MPEVISYLVISLLYVTESQLKDHCPLSVSSLYMNLNAQSNISGTMGKVHFHNFRHGWRVIWRSNLHRPTAQIQARPGCQNQSAAVRVVQPTAPIRSL